MPVQQRPRLREQEDLLRQAEVRESQEREQLSRDDEESSRRKRTAEDARLESKEEVRTLRGFLFDCSRKEVAV